MSGRWLHALLAILSCTVVLGCSDSDPDKGSQPTTCASKRLSHDYIVEWRDGGITRVRTRDLDGWLEGRRADVLAVEPNYLLPRALPVAGEGPSLATEELQRLIGASSAWDRAIFGTGIKVAVIDTGVDLTNPLLKDQLLVNETELRGAEGVDDDENGFIDDIYGWNVNSNSPAVVDELGHGTSVAGLITGPLRNGVSLALAPGAKILPVDFIVGETGTEFDAKKGIEYALKRGVNIINNSWSIPCSDLLKKSFAAWADSNVLFVNAAGNDPVDVTVRGAIPSSLTARNFLNVGSVDNAGRPSSFSGYGTSVGVFTIGEDLPILGRPKSGEGKAVSSGTSLSAAIVSGAAALVWSAKPNLTASEVGDILRQGSGFRVNGPRILNLPAAIDKLAP